MAVKKDQTPWEYAKGTSFLHRLPGGIKLVFLLVFSGGVFFSDLYAIGCLAVFLVLLAIATGINPLGLLRGGLPLVLFVLIIFLIGAVEYSPAIAEQGWLPFTINCDSIKNGLLFSLRIIISFTAGALFFRVCTMSEIRRSFNSAEKFFRIKKLQSGLSVSLMLGFLPKFFVIWEELNTAWDARAGKKGLMRIIKILPLLIERLMEKAASTAAALESRRGE